MHRSQPTLDDARRLYLAGEHRRAIPICRRLLKGARNDPDVLFVLGACEVSAAMFDEGREHIEKAIKRRPTDPHYYRPLATVHLMYGRMDEAHETLDRALRFSPHFAPVIADKAELLILENRLDEARALIEPQVEAHPDNGRVASTFAQLCMASGDYARAVPVLESFLARPGLTPSQRIGPLFRLALLQDKLGRHDESFATLEQANRLAARRHDPADTLRIVDAIVEAWTPDALERARATSDPDGAAPVFIVGMPRSGTSLVEQILASHPECFGAGELDLLDRAAIDLQQGAGAPAPSILTRPDLLDPERTGAAAHRYIEARDALCATDAALVCDKMPSNAFNIGLAASMFPGARFIHCTRDPLDTILSCYAHHFVGHLPFAYDIEHLAHFYIQYARVMEHWHTLLPGAILDVSYEALVAEPRETIGGMLAHLGLPWDDACLAFHEADRVTRTASNEQVRRPLYTSSVGRWRRYERHLEPARRILEGA